VSARMETIGRGVFVIGLLAGVGALAVIFGRSIFNTPPEAPATERLAPLLAHADVVYNRERQDLSRELGGRTVLLSVPQANNEEAAGRGMLLLLQQAQWTVTGRGGAISPDGSLCLAVSTPTFWLEDSANRELRKDLEAAQAKAGNATVVVDMFFCSDPQQP
jgi:hypothetical protein